MPDPEIHGDNIDDRNAIWKEEWDAECRQLELDEETEGFDVDYEDEDVDYDYLIE